MNQDERLTVPEWAKGKIGPLAKGKCKAPHYIKWVASKPCVICGNTEIEVHHFVFKSQGGSDFHTVPLCKFHHDIMHGKPDAQEYKSNHGRIELWKIQCEMKETINDRAVELLIEYIRRREGI